MSNKDLTDHISEDGLTADSTHLCDHHNDLSAESTLIGDPHSQAEAFAPQTLDFDCAVQAQANLISLFEGHPFSESQAVFEAAEHGLLTENGTSMGDVGGLLELHGIGVHRVENGSIQDLVGEISAGRGVIVGVNSSELWDPGFTTWLEDKFGFKGADHAITVSGVDMSDPNHPMVIVNDTGLSDGGGDMYPLDQFVDAWGNSGRFYVATDNPLPGHQPDDGSLYDLLNKDGVLDANPQLAYEAGRSVSGFTQNDWDHLLS